VGDVLDLFHEPVQTWFRTSFRSPTRPQRLGWPVIARGESTLILAPTGTGKTLAAFLACLDRLMFDPAADRKSRCRVLYVSPLKALAVDVERNLRAPLAGIFNVATSQGVSVLAPAIALRTGDTPSTDRAIPQLVNQATDQGVARVRRDAQSAKLTSTHLDSTSHPPVWPLLTSQICWSSPRPGCSRRWRWGSSHASGFRRSCSRSCWAS